MMFRTLFLLVLSSFWTIGSSELTAKIVSCPAWYVFVNVDPQDVLSFLYDFLLYFCHVIKCH
jgi:hypothetical protein